MRSRPDGSIRTAGYSGFGAERLTASFVGLVVWMALALGFSQLAEARSSTRLCDNSQADQVEVLKPNETTVRFKVLDPNDECLCRAIQDDIDAFDRSLDELVDEVRFANKNGPQAPLSEDAKSILNFGKAMNKAAPNDTRSREIAFQRLMTELKGSEGNTFFSVTPPANGAVAQNSATCWRKQDLMTYFLEAAKLFDPAFRK